MIRIAICDDEEVHCRIAYRILKNYFEKNKIEWEADIYLSGHKFMSSSQFYEIVFMDIELKDENGMKIAGQYRKVHDSILI